MIKRIKEFIALLSGLLALLLPVPMGGEDLFKTPSAVSICVGVIIAFYFYYAKNKHWPALNKNTLLSAFALLLVSFIIYFTLYQTIDTPNDVVIIIETVSYCAFAFLLAALVSLLAAAGVNRKSERP